jgi:hypothetical protein
MHCSREYKKGFHDMCEQKPSPLFVLFGWNSISVSSLVMQSVYLDLVEMRLDVDAVCLCFTSCRSGPLTGYCTCQLEEQWGL